MTSEKSIVLIGFMGVGKTTIGKELADNLDWEFIDTDDVIENDFGMPTTKIFQTYGEPVFRKKERECITDLSSKTKRVISVGGGAFLQEEIRNVCMDNTTVVHLTMSFEAWKNRIPAIIDSRPVLQGKSMVEIKVLFDERKAVYKHHHLQINVDDWTPKEAVAEIIKRLDLDSVDQL